MTELAEKNSPKGDAKALTTREALLQAAISELSLRSEAEFRIEAILAATGASFSSLYHHFGSREGLIIEAQIVIFKSPITRDVAPFAAAASQVSNAAEVRAVLAAAIATSSSAKNTKDRAAQIAILASANSRPVLATAIAKEQAELTKQIAAAFDDLERRGIIKPKVATTLIGQYIQVTILGQSVLDAGTGPLEIKDWQDLLLTTLLTLVNPVTDI